MFKLESNASFPANCSFQCPLFPRYMRLTYGHVLNKQWHRSRCCAGSCGLVSSSAAVVFSKEEADEIRPPGKTLLQNGSARYTNREARWRVWKWTETRLNSAVMEADYYW